MESHKVEATGIKLYLMVYVAILLLGAMQVFLAYHSQTTVLHISDPNGAGHVNTSRLLLRMLMIAIVQAALAISVFMHLRWERRSLMLALIPTTVFVLLMMNMIWTDSFRLLYLKPFLH